MIKVGAVTILTDPGSYTVEEHSKLEGIDFILFTHEHGDHYHLESLKVILEKNPQAKIYANNSVSDLLEQAGIAYTKIEHQQNFSLAGVEVVGIGEKHAEMHSSIPLSANLGFLIDNKLWYPGDAFTDPEQPVEILALPVSGPWMKIGEAVDYALKLKPKKAFPVHDGTRFGSAHTIPQRVLTPEGIEFVPIVEGDEREF